jgi:uncharacterized membrane protein
MTLTPLFPIVLIGLLHWLLPSFVPPTLPFGVRIPSDRAGAPVIAVWRRRYRYGTALVTIAVVAGTLVLHDRVWAGPVAVGAELLAGVVLYLVARRRITAVKTVEEWFGGRRQVVVADTSLRTDPEPYPWLWGIPAILLLAATVITGIVEYPRMPARLGIHLGPGGRPDHYAAKSVSSAFAMVAAQIFMTALLFAVARIAVRGRAQLDAEDPQAAARHRRFVSATARALLVLAACMNVTSFLAALTVWNTINGPAVVALAPLPGLAGVIVLLAVVLRTGQGGSRLRLGGPGNNAPHTVNRDDDRLYRWGLFYFNRDDPALFVPKRFGIGWTLNMARPLAWVMLAATVAAIAIGPLTH